MNNRMRRVGAIILIVIMIALIIWMVWCGVTGSPYFMGSVFAAILFPVLVYVYFFIYRMIRGRNEDREAREKEAQTRQTQARETQVRETQEKNPRLDGSQAKEAQKGSAKSAGKNGKKKNR